MLCTCNMKNVLCSAEKSSVIWAEPHSRSSAKQFGRTERSVVTSTWIFGITIGGFQNCGVVVNFERIWIPKQQRYQYAFLMSIKGIRNISSFRKSQKKCSSAPSTVQQRKIVLGLGHPDSSENLCNFDKVFEGVS